MRNVTTLGIAAAAALSLAACASTKFNSTWKAPDSQPLNFQGQKVAAVVISPHESTRLGAEASWHGSSSGGECRRSPPTT
jgi:hypothetical protein